MKIILSSLAVLLVSTLALVAGDSAAEKAFVEKYKKAYEGNDKATLESFLYTEGAHPMALEFFKMMMTEGAGGKLSGIEMVDLTAEEMKEAAGTEEGPDGVKTKMPLKVTKKLKISTSTKDSSGSSSGSSSVLVAEHNGKFVIPVPAAVK